MALPARAPRRRAALGIAAIAGVALALAFARSCTRPGPDLGGVRPESRPGREGSGDALARGGSRDAADGIEVRLGIPEPSPAAGWEDAAEAVCAELRAVLDGHARSGAYVEARAEAARQDLVLFPPPRSRVRRMLLGSERMRVLALAALAARPELDDDLLRIVLRSQRPEDDDVVRLLGAEVAAGAAPDLLSRHEDELLRAFEGETNPLVLSVALPALERMDEGRLRALMRAQVAAAPPEMLPVLLALAKGRLPSAAAVELTPAARRANHPAAASGAAASR